MAAARAEPAGLKCIPRCPAAFEEVLRVVTVAAIPTARCIRPPFAERATNPAELFSFVVSRGFLSGFPWLQSVLEKPEHYRKMQKLEHTFLLQDHFFTHLRDALREVFEKKVSNPSSVIDGQLAVGKILVEPKFGAGIL